MVSRYARHLPIVLVAYHEPTTTRFDTVTIDDHQGAKIAVETLLTKGHRDIGLLAHWNSGERRATVITQRERGYREAMTAAGLEPRVFELTASPVGRRAELEAFLECPDRPQAVFCWSDLDALPLRELAHERRLRMRGTSLLAPTKILPWPLRRS